MTSRDGGSSGFSTTSTISPSPFVTQTPYRLAADSETSSTRNAASVSVSCCRRSTSARFAWNTLSPSMTTKSSSTYGSAVRRACASPSCSRWWA
jgi:hypothetical protein